MSGVGGEFYTTGGLGRPVLDFGITHGSLVGLVTESSMAHRRRFAGP